MKKKKRKIFHALQAWHFLYDHPAFRLRERTAGPEYTTDGKARSGYKEVTFQGRTYGFFESRHLHHHALQEHLYIHYTAVDETGRVNDDKTKNHYPEVWLEFGELRYYGQDYIESFDKHNHEGWYDGIRPEQLNNEYFARIQSVHDHKLDCGAPTFDEALVKLANLVLKEYGDYKNDDNERATCGGVNECADCKHMSTWRLGHGV